MGHMHAAIYQLMPAIQFFFCLKNVNTGKCFFKKLSCRGLEKQTLLICPSIRRRLEDFIDKSHKKRTVNE